MEDKELIKIMKTQHTLLAIMFVFVMIAFVLGLYAAYKWGEIQSMYSMLLKYLDMNV